MLPSEVPDNKGTCDEVICPQVCHITVINRKLALVTHIS